MISQCKRSVAMLSLALLLLPAGLPVAAAGQAAAVERAAAPKALFISILEGEGELNDVRARTAREPIVQVEDENHKPVAGALVLFTIHSGGQPAATFSGLSSLSVRTGADGRAVGRGFRITNHTGNFRIEIVATVAAVQAIAEIHQTNFMKGSRVSRLLTTHQALTLSVAELAAFAAASSAILVTSRDPSATQVTVGTGSVGAPR